MKESLTRKILKEKKLRFTNVRNEILSIFDKSSYALSYYDLEKELNSSYDMATIYRTLSTFLKKKIIHQVPLESKTSYYALNHDLGYSETTRKEHIHFVCKDCRHTFCLDDVLIKNIKLKNNFQLQSIKIIAEGLCSSCRGK